jgi:hypothetical protein
MTHYKSKRSQAGEGELYFFGIVVVVCALISGSLFVFNWFKDTKDEKLDARRQAQIKKRTPTKFVAPKDPDAYFVSCKKKLWQALNSDVSCDVMPESYGELEFLSYEYE